jgi:hypothetical protein
MCSLYDAFMIHLSRIRILFMNLFASTFLFVPTQFLASLHLCINAHSSFDSFASLRYYSFISMSMNSFVILIPLAVA